MSTQKEHLVIFDTTLRDGEQSPGASMTKKEKVRIAKMLEKMQVDVIEAGFPAASEGDFAAVKAVADTVKTSTVCGLARAVDRDIEHAGAALANAESARIHTFIATSPMHMRTKLKMSPDEVVERAVYAVKKALSYTDNVEFSPEDAGRSEADFLCRVIEAVIDAGATTINIPDTVGYTMPWEFGALISNLRERIPNADKAIFSVHCHNDLGLAVGNSLSAVMNGARQVECTINGLGERAGNASLEEVVMALRTRPNVFTCDTRIVTEHIVPTSRLVSGITGFAVQPNKAIVGANAFAHESGIHQDGVLKHRENYEIMRAEDVGWSQNRLVLGKHSGRNAFRTHIKEKWGIELESEEAVKKAFSRFKKLADLKHEVYDEDLFSIVANTESVTGKERYRLISSWVCSETGETPMGKVTLVIDDKEVQSSAQGDGPIDAVYKAIKAATGTTAKLTLYSVNNITEGTDAQGEVTVQLDQDGHLVNGQGADTDIVIASAKAYIDALNWLDRRPASHPHPQYGEV